jgi:5-formyltetrahydrofolate cyclo-ligase
MSLESETIQEDFLEVDSKIPGQNYVCLSFVSPEKALKQKEVFNVTKFLEFLFNDNEIGTVDVREKLMNKEIQITYDEISKIYDDWKYTRTEDLESQFFEKNDYHTSMRGLKVRGVYDTYKEAGVRAQVLRRKDPSFNVFVGQIGYWLPWDPECESVTEQEFQENQLNELVKKYKENLSSRDTLYDQVKNERIQKANKEVASRKEVLKAQNEMKIPEDNAETDSKIIEQLRNIVDESDKLYYDNLKRNQEQKSQPTDQEVNESEMAPVKNDDIKVESMENLEADDPWIARKKI